MQLHRPPRRSSDVLRIGVGPVFRRAGIIGVLAAAGGLACTEPTAVGIQRIAQILQVIQKHAGGQHDRVVVTKHAFDGDRKLVVVARHVGIEKVKAQHPPAIEQALGDIFVGRVQIRQVVHPPAVVAGDMRLVGLLWRLRGDAQVLGARFRQFVREQAQLHFHCSSLAGGGHGHLAHQMLAIHPKSIARHAWKHRGDRIVGSEGAGQFIAGCMLRHRRKRLHR